MKKHKFLPKPAGILMTLGILVIAVSAAALAAELLRGDANGDGAVNASDVSELRERLCAGDISAGDLAAGDVNGDGAVNLKDVTVLRRTLAGERTGTASSSGDVSESGTPSASDAGSSSGDGSAASSDTSLSDGDTSDSGASVKNGITAEAFPYGTSVKGRELICWSIRPEAYDRTILLNFEIHGWEDGYAGDGQVLVDLGNALVCHYSENADLHGCRLLIIPSANPDGLAEGTTNNGFGRCNADGIDLNRDFDAAYQAQTSARNYTPAAFSGKESRALRDLVLAEEPDIVIDFHGWETMILGSSDIAEVFSLYAGLNQKNELTAAATGYFSYWAQCQGAEAALVEFKDSDSVSAENVITAVDHLLADDYGSKYSDYEADNRYSAFGNVQCYAAESGRIYTQAAPGADGTDFGYIDGENDLCTIRQIYANGWCKVAYPAGASGYRKTGFCPLSAFIPAADSVEPYETHTAGNTAVYRTPELTVQFGTVWSTDTVTVVAQRGSVLEIIYPLDGGGFKMGWIAANAAV